MKSMEAAMDQGGQTVMVGDLVRILSDNVTAKVHEIAEDFGTHFVRLRPAHQSRGKGVWHAAEHVALLKRERKPADANN